MADNYSTTRDRIHKKSRNYFVFELGRWDKQKRDMFYGATDALLDASEAASTYEASVVSSPTAKLLACYGFLQALYIEQDAVRVLSGAVGMDWNPNDDEVLKKIRDARNRLTGHPALAGESRKSRRPSSSIIPSFSITSQKFIGHIYYSDGTEQIEVEVAKFRQENEDHLATQMKLVESKMDNQEKAFRNSEAKRPLSAAFGTGFRYLVDRLHCDLNNEDRLIQAQGHAQRIRDVMKKLEVDLQSRDFKPELSLLPIVLTGLDLLEKIMKKQERTESAQHEFDLIFDGLRIQISQLQQSLAALDAKLQTPI